MTKQQRKKATEASARWRQRNPNHARDYYQAHRAKILKHQKQKRKENLAASLAYHRAMYHKHRRAFCGTQKCCDICKKIRPLVIDHSHGFCNHRRITYHCRSCRRGLLCRGCNNGLGMFHESLKLLGDGKAGQYLRRWAIILKSRRKNERIHKKYDRL
jgi:hypothetical protein